MSQKKILVVDDEKDIQTTLKKTLTCQGYSVIVADTGKKAVALAKSNRPDLVILDVALPDLLGGQVAEVIQGIPGMRDVPIIFLTALLAKNEERKYGRIVGGKTMFAKPYDAEELLTAISELLHGQDCNVL